MQKIVIKTQTGSVYRIDPNLKFYERLMPIGEILHRADYGFYDNLEWQMREDGLRIALTTEESNRPLVTPPIKLVESA